MEPWDPSPQTEKSTRVRTKSTNSSINRLPRYAHLDLVEQGVRVDVPRELDLLVAQQLPGVMVVVDGWMWGDKDDVHVGGRSIGRSRTASQPPPAAPGRHAERRRRNRQERTYMRIRFPMVWSSLLMVSVPELGIFSLAASFHSHLRSPSASRYDSERGGAFMAAAAWLAVRAWWWIVRGVACGSVAARGGVECWGGSGQT